MDKRTKAEFDRTRSSTTASWPLPLLQNLCGLRGRPLTGELSTALECENDPNVTPVRGGPPSPRLPQTILPLHEITPEAYAERANIQFGSDAVTNSV
jgi:hypothetical protein